MKQDSLRVRSTLPMPRLKRVPLSAIVPSPALSVHVPSEEVMRLAESVRRHGLLQPIGVRKKPGFPVRYELLFGYRRFLACRALFVPRVPCLVFPDRRDAALYTASENFLRKTTDPASLSALASRLSLSLGDFCARLPLPCPEDEKAPISRDISLFLEEDAVPPSPVPKRRGVVRDARLVANSIERAVCAGRDAGVCVEIQKVCHDREWHYHIRLGLGADARLSEELSRVA